MQNAFSIALLGSAMALLGVIVANVFALITHRQRLDHEARLKKEERDWTSRRDVYLKVIEELAKNFKYLNTFADFSISPKEHSSLIERFGESASKVHLIGSWETIQKVTVANELFLKAMFELIGLRMPLLQAADEVARLNSKLKSGETRHNSIVKEAMARPLSAEESKLVRETLEEIKSVDETHIQQREVLQQEINSKRYALMRKSQERSLEYSATLIEANISIRRELNLPLDEDHYRRLMSKARSDASLHVEELFKSVYPEP